MSNIKTTIQEGIDSVVQIPYGENVGVKIYSSDGNLSHYSAVTKLALKSSFFNFITRSVLYLSQKKTERRVVKVERQAETLTATKKESLLMQQQEIEALKALRVYLKAIRIYGNKPKAK